MSNTSIINPNTNHQRTMNKNLGPLFEAHARRQDPDTSHQAAAAFRGKAAGRAEQIVLDALNRLGGSGTAYQIERVARRVHPNIDSNTITPRLKPLERKRLVRRTDKRGPGRGSRKQIVWEVLS